MYAQQGLMSIKNDVIVGKNYRNNKTITAKEYTFRDKIDEIFLDNFSKKVYLKNRCVNKINNTNLPQGMVYCIEGDNLIWKKEIDYGNARGFLLDHYLVQELQFGSVIYNKLNGTKMWQTKSKIFYVNEKKQIALAHRYIYNDNENSFFEGLDLKTGDKKWEIELHNKY
jgi:hypothetical protein